MNLSQYIDNLNARFQTGISREHAYRGDLQQLLKVCCQALWPPMNRRELIAVRQIMY